MSFKTPFKQSNRNQCLRLAIKHSKLYYQPLGEVCYVKGGSPLSKEYIRNHPGPFPMIGAGQQPLGFVSTYNTEDPLGITGAGTIGHLTWCEGKCFRTNVNWSCLPKRPDLLLPRYLYHLLTEMNRELHALASHDGIPRLNQCNLAKLIIPIPPMRDQQDIVTKLDTLTELEAQMKRYRYLRRQLLDFDGNNVTIKALGEICTVKLGKALSKKYINTHVRLPSTPTPNSTYAHTCQEVK